MGTTLKDVREEIKTATDTRVPNRAALGGGLPVIIKAQDRIDSLGKTIAAAKKELAVLVELCSGYVLEHPSVFDDGLTVYSDKTDHGDITFDDVVYHFVRGYGDPKREGGNNITQAFIASLPENMRKTKYVLDVGACTDKELEAVGLYRPAKYTWS